MTMDGYMVDLNVCISKKGVNLSTHYGSMGLVYLPT